MNIPKKLKVGGLQYDVEITNHMYLGAANVSAEIMYDELKIRVARTRNAECRRISCMKRSMRFSTISGTGSTTKRKLMSWRRLCMR